jgi:hypothetical protein
MHELTTVAKLNSLLRCAAAEKKPAAAANLSGCRKVIWIKNQEKQELSDSSSLTTDKAAFPFGLPFTEQVMK